MSAPTSNNISTPLFREEGLRFLRNLRRNNRREWFDPRKPQFERELKQPLLALIGTINHAMEGFAPAHLRPPQKCIMRIYRDIRFSPDKRPYKSHVSAWWPREGLEKTTGAGYYLQIGDSDVIIAAGVYMPERDPLRAIREYLLVHHGEVRSLMGDQTLMRLMKTMNGNPLTRAPKGFPKEHPAMDLLLCRQWAVEATLPADAVLKKKFSAEVVRRFRLATPLVDALNTPLRAQSHKHRKPLFGL